MGYFRTYPEPVRFNPQGITNIISLSNMAKYYQVKMDTTIEDSITLFKTDSGELKFTPTEKGLYYCPWSTDKPNFWAFLSTVLSQPDKYTNRAVSQEKMACQFQNITMHPGSQQLMDVAINHIKNCPITKSDILAAEDIFRLNLGSLRGKTVV